MRRQSWGFPSQRMERSKLGARTLLGLFVLLLLTSGGIQTLGAIDLVAKVEEYMQARVKVSRFSGSILVARDGKALAAKGYGYANAEWEIPNTPQTKFRLASITKQFTAMAILQLQELGKLSVQDPISKYLENLPEAWAPVTIHHLLSHTSGIPSFTDYPEYPEKMTIATPPDKLAERVFDKPLAFEPGEGWAYSNTG